MTSDCPHFLRRALRIWVSALLQLTDALAGDAWHEYHARTFVTHDDAFFDMMIATLAGCV